MGTRTANATKSATSTPAAKTSRTARKGTAKPAEKVAPVEALPTPEKAQKSVRVHCDINATLPKGNGGVRFNERASKDGRTVVGSVYIEQATWATLGKPSVITVDVKAAS